MGIEDREAKAAVDGGRLVLGFDADCAACSDIARRIRDELGESIEARPLADPELARWREESLGEDAPWTPTLFEVEGGRVRAWTGARLALTLAARLGPVKAWRLAKVLGGAEPSWDGPAASETAGGLSRGDFLKGLGGVVVGLSMLGVPVGSAAALTRPSVYMGLGNLGNLPSRHPLSWFYTRMHVDGFWFNGLNMTDPQLAVVIKRTRARNVIAPQLVCNPKDSSHNAPCYAGGGTRTLKIAPYGTPERVERVRDRQNVPGLNATHVALDILSAYAGGYARGIPAQVYAAKRRYQGKKILVIVHLAWINGGPIPAQLSNIIRASDGVVVESAPYRLAEKKLAKRSWVILHARMRALRRPLLWLANRGQDPPGQRGYGLRTYLPRMKQTVAWMRSGRTLPLAIIPVNYGSPPLLAPAPEITSTRPRTETNTLTGATRWLLRFYAG